MNHIIKEMLPFLTDSKQSTANEIFQNVSETLQRKTHHSSDIRGNASDPTVSQHQHRVLQSLHQRHWNLHAYV